MSVLPRFFAPACKRERHPRLGRFGRMSEEEVRAFALKHDLTVEQARRVLDAHGADEGSWDETARSLIHFLKAPS